MSDATQPLRFAKGHGLGNDYLVVHAGELPAALTSERAVMLCDRHHGAGSDGILVGDLSGRPEGPFRLRIVNPDGTEAEKSGNGLRIFATWLHARGAVRTGEWFEVQLPRDTVRMRVEGFVGEAAAPNEAAPREGGPWEAGGKEAGGKEAGGKEAGGKEAGGQEAGGQEAGGQEAGKQKAGKQKAGMQEGRLQEAGALVVRVEMGRALFSAREAGFTGPGTPGGGVGPEGGAPRHLRGAADAAAGARLAAGSSDEVGGGVPLELPGGSATVHPLSLGNPHCVVLVDALEREDFLLRAPVLCTHQAFPAGTNVQWARVAGPRVLEAWIWERGAGETLASGSSACAVAAVGVRNGLVKAGALEVRMPGGSVQVDVTDDFEITLVGPAQMIYEGALTEALTEAWIGLGS